MRGQFEPHRHEVLARRLSDELEKRLPRGITLDPAARDALEREFAGRLDASADPDRLHETWQKNLDRYIKSGTSSRRAGQGPLSSDDVLREFKLCGQVCPGPAAPRGSSPDRSRK